MFRLVSRLITSVLEGRFMGIYDQVKVLPLCHLRKKFHHSKATIFHTGWNEGVKDEEEKEGRDRELFR